jgi:hypothetical protein
VIKQQERLDEGRSDWMELTSQQKVTPNDHCEVRKWEDLEVLKSEV